MQLIKLPITLDAMTAQVTMTGLTILKSGRYKDRHGGLKEFTQLPTNQFLLKKNVPKESLQISNLKQVKKKVPTPTRKVKTLDKPVRNYTIKKKEVTHRIKNFVNQMQNEKKLFFWTITFPLGTSDDIAFICYNKWLTRVRKELNLRSYLWITERQVNGTIHFHITIHQRLCVRKANQFMRACLFTCIDNKEISYSREAAKNYNGVDIAKNRKSRKVINFAQKKSTKALVSYLTKYITKNNGSFKHLAWHSSRDYSNLCISVRISEHELLNTNTLQFFKKTPLFSSDWMDFYSWIGEPPKEFLKYLSQLNHNIVSQINSTR
jgi:hypothetical protein